MLHILFTLSFFQAENPLDSMNKYRNSWKQAVDSQMIYSKQLTQTTDKVQYNIIKKRLNKCIDVSFDSYYKYFKYRDKLHNKDSVPL